MDDQSDPKFKTIIEEAHKVAEELLLYVPAMPNLGPLGALAALGIAFAYACAYGGIDVESSTVKTLLKNKYDSAKELLKQFDQSLNIPPENPTNKPN